jgi:hypothetical protein
MFVEKAKEGVTSLIVPGDEDKEHTVRFCLRGLGRLMGG